MSEGGHVMRLIGDLPAESQKRVWVIAQILRDLIADPENGYEAELAFTLVMAEVADQITSNAKEVKQ